MIVSNDRLFQSKDEYSKTHELHDISRHFPVATTNIIKINESAKIAAAKLASYLVDNYGEHVGCFYGIDVERKKSDTSSDYYTNLHKHITKRIAADTSASPNTITYDKFKLDKDDGWIVLYVKAGTPDDEFDFGFDDSDYMIEDDSAPNLPLALASLSDDGDDIYSNSAAQTMLNALLRLFIKLTHINKLPYDKDFIRQNQLNLNAKAFFFFSESISKKGVYLRVIDPDVWVSSQNEIVTSISHRKLFYPGTNSMVIKSQQIDMVVPKISPAKGNSGFDIGSLSNDIRQVNAATGHGQPKYINLKDISSSTFLYENYLAELMRGLCTAAKIDVTYNVFEPTYRGRPSIALDRKPVKKKLVIINAVPEFMRSNSFIDKYAKTTPSPVDFTYSQAVDIYIGFIKTYFNEYDVSVLQSMPNCSYDGLDDDCAYLVIQESLNDDEEYWYSTHKDFQPKMLETYGEKWPAQMTSARARYHHKKSDTIAAKKSKELTESELDILELLAQEKMFKYESDFIKLITIQKKAQETYVPFYTHPYTLWKIQQVQSGVKGNRKKAIQALHMPTIEVYDVLIKASNLADGGGWLDALRGHNKAISDQPEFKQKPFSEYVKKQKNTIKQEQLISKKEESVLSNIKLNILLKSYLTTNLILPLCNSESDLKDFSDYAGKYRAYYIRRPTINRTSSSLLASQLELSITTKGVSVRFIRLLDTESKLRSTEPALNEEAFKRLYNGAFYLINDKNEVMNTYTSKRIERLLASVPPTGSLQGMTFYAVYNKKAANTPYDELIPWAKNLKSKIDKYGNDVSNESGLIPFLAHSSSTENHHKNPGSGGQEWLYIEDRGLDGMLTYLCPTSDINQNVAKGISIKNTEMYDKDGNKIHTAAHPMAGLHLNTTSFNVANVNDFSSTSILETIAKIALLN